MMWFSTTPAEGIARGQAGKEIRHGIVLQRQRLQPERDAQTGEQANNSSDEHAYGVGLFAEHAQKHQAEQRAAQAVHQFVDNREHAVRFADGRNQHQRQQSRDNADGQR